MKSFLAVVSLIFAFQSFAEDSNKYRDEKDASRIADDLTQILNAEKAGKTYRSGSGLDLMALALADFKVVKIRYSNFADLCSAELFFDKPLISGTSGNSLSILVPTSRGYFSNKCNTLTPSEISEKRESQDNSDRGILNKDQTEFSSSSSKSEATRQ